MILEGIVTTLERDGSVNVAPMGPTVDQPPTPELRSFVLRPFRTSRTYGNLDRIGQGVLHVTDDVLLLAEATIGSPSPPTEPTRVIHGRRLTDCCRFFEFRVIGRDVRDDRARFDCEVVHAERVRDFFGFHRARHAVLEAAILVSRIGILPYERLDEDFERLRYAVEKTGGPAEIQAFGILRQQLSKASEGISRTE